MKSWISCLLVLALARTSASPLEKEVPEVVHQIYDYQSPNFFFYLSLLSVQTFLRPRKHILYVNDEGRYRRGHWESWLSRARESFDLFRKQNPSTAFVPSSSQSASVLDIHDRSRVDYTSYLSHFASLIEMKKIEVRLLTFPAYPFGNTTHYAANKAHRSDFLRMEVLRDQGGIYLDTDVFVHPSTSSPVSVESAQLQHRYQWFDSAAHPLQSLRQHQFVIGFDNIVNLDDYTPNAMKDGSSSKNAQEWTSQLSITTLPKRLNNGVLLSTANNSFLTLWAAEYQRAYHPNSFDYDSSVVPFKLATLYPDLVHIEMHRLSPVSYSFQTARLAEALTCGIFIEKVDNYPDLLRRFPSLVAKRGHSAMWYPTYDWDKKQYSFAANKDGPDVFMMDATKRKLLFHLTMSQVRGICMMRKQLGAPEDLEALPSYLGHVFRLSYFGYDAFDYSLPITVPSQALDEDKDTERDKVWKRCRDQMGMYSTPDKDYDELHRQQYSKHHLPE